jgi:hypothetical protein
MRSSTHCICSGGVHSSGMVRRVQYSSHRVPDGSTCLPCAEQQRRNATSLCCMPHTHTYCWPSSGPLTLGTPGNLGPNTTVTMVSDVHDWPATTHTNHLGLLFEASVTENSLASRGCWGSRRNGVSEIQVVVLCIVLPGCMSVGSARLSQLLCW